MRAEVIAIGDELVSGQRLDTNSQWLSQQLGDLGIDTMFHSTVGDDLAANITVFQTAVERADLVISTGGLGPTADDLTREAMARTLGVELYEDAESLAHIQSLFESRGRQMPERNRLQAMFPVGSCPVPNPHGTAPGIWAEAPRAHQTPCHLVALPGVPAEMREMWFASVVPRLAELSPEKRVVYHRLIQCFGIGESHLESLLPDLIKRGREPRVGITASGATITLRITASGPDEATCIAATEPTAKTIYEVASKYIFGEGDCRLEQVVLNLLKERGKTLATDESLTAGLLAEWLMAEADGDGIYRGGRIEPLPLSAPKQRAETIREQLSADYGLVVGPADGDEVELALSDGSDTLSISINSASHPDVLKPRIAKSALNLLRRHLLSFPSV